MPRKRKSSATEESPVEENSKIIPMGSELVRRVQSLKYLPPTEYSHFSPEAGGACRKRSVGESSEKEEMKANAPVCVHVLLNRLSPKDIEDALRREWKKEDGGLKKNKAKCITSQHIHQFNYRQELLVFAETKFSALVSDAFQCLKPTGVRGGDGNLDEDLESNVFFKYLKERFDALYRQCVQENWVICVPRQGVFGPDMTDITQEDVLGHILVPREDDKESSSGIGHFRTLTDHQVSVTPSNLIDLVHEFGRLEARILFRVSYYCTLDNVKFKHSVWCLSASLSSDRVAILEESVQPLKSISTCISHLKALNKSHHLDALDDKIREFLKNLRVESVTAIPQLKHSVVTLIQECRDSLQTAESVKTFTGLRARHANLALESYVLYHLHPTLLYILAGFTCEEDSQLNKAIQYINALEPPYEIPPDVFELARHEFLRLEVLRTPLEKLECLCRVAQQVSEGLGRKGDIAASDDILTALVHLVLRHPSNRWFAEFAFISEFSDAIVHHEMDERAYFLASLEAALEHVKSAKGFPALVCAPALEPVLEDVESRQQKQFREAWSLTLQDKAEEVMEVMKDAKHCTIEALQQLCHPLCTCERCEAVVLQIEHLIRVPDARGMTLLHVAAAAGAVNVLEALLKHVTNDSHDPVTQGSKESRDNPGRDISRPDSAFKWTPLHHAARLGHQNALLLLLHAAADASLPDGEGRLPLHLAAMRGHESCVKAMLYYAEHTGPALDVNHQDCYGSSALHYASYWGHLGIVRILLGYDANPFLKNRRKETPQDLAPNVHVENALKNSAANRLVSTAWVVVSLRSERGHRGPPTPSARERELRSKCFKAIAIGDVQLACYYLGIQPSTQDCDCEGQCASTLRSALPLDSANEDGYSALHMAILYHSTSLVDALLKHGANPNVRTGGGMTALHLACQCNLLDIVGLLLKEPVDASAQDKFRNTALHYAAIMGSGALVELLLGCPRARLSLKLKNRSNRTPRQEAIQRKHKEIIPLLRNAEMDG
ncbi:unnamed protein product [Cyprideis torosa]|uniref:Uncharacterized protein n=1 Tax=Cyprideis torosa TaxID=163714 RepID=A0A7R8WR80_9CRUS|nr:unnamed protein product [Cyprideis torosa]CAG0903538.1 unnamed protein product [Cyprideis torosa]